ncbi:MAG: 2-(1,2-epoxy-1,2-dihydrophenyl)acetyl-CoA isomerase [Alphaproteobacteria bacterium]|nr:2-(1,2-epoxy-1,2-dihydrophenyl)acetyl-CoA isomerase [Alphaproteobacteria bacterium]
MNDTVLVDDHDGWVKITLNRPDRLNSLNVDLHLALRAALDAARQSRAVLITGAGRGFCAGQDLGERNPDSGDWPPDLGAMLRDYFNPLIRQVSDLPVPVVCAVNGVAAGAGASLALACDIVLAARSAKFIQAFSKIGLAPDAGASWLLPARIGQARAIALALTGAPVTAEQAADWGMIWQCHDDAALMPAAEALVSQLAAGPTAAYAATKSLVQDAAANSLSEQLDAEAAAQQALGRSADYAEGVRAFLAKRPARFGG